VLSGIAVDAVEGFMVVVGERDGRGGLRGLA
jgi:hypothetical protein